LLELEFPSPPEFQQPGNCPQTPTFQDHFTALDLAANTGHQLGTFYRPSKLRATRRFSLHRVFETLDRRFEYDNDIQALVTRLAQGTGNSIVSTNWNIVIEKHAHDAGLRVLPSQSAAPISGGVPFL
jgi:hypothetical protein